MQPQQRSPDWLVAAVPTLLVAAVAGILGLIVQVSKIDAGLTAIADDLRELKDETRSRLTDLETRVRTLEMKK
jgi:hypothetical protein